MGRVAGESESALPEVPPLPQRAAIYITPDGNVQFGALFEDLVPVAAAVSATEPAALIRPARVDGEVER
jgi:hypothetical protein